MENRMPKKFIQIAIQTSKYGHTVYALTEDGDMYFSREPRDNPNSARWVRIRNINEQEESDRKEAEEWSKEMPQIVQTDVPVSVPTERDGIMKVRDMLQNEWDGGGEHPDFYNHVRHFLNRIDRELLK